MRCTPQTARFTRARTRTPCPTGARSTRPAKGGRSPATSTTGWGASWRTAARGSPRALWGGLPPARPPLPGAKFRLAAPPPPERQATFPLLTANVRVSAWGTLHFKTLPALVGTLLRVGVLRADGQPKYKRPLWLFWSGPE